VCGRLQGSLDLGETVPSVCSETGLTLSADGSEGGDVRAEEVKQTQEEDDRLAVVLPAVKAAAAVCYICNIVVLALAILSVCYVMFTCDFTVKTKAVCSFESLVPTHEIKHSNM